MTQFSCPRCGFINAYQIANPNPPPVRIQFCPNCDWGNNLQTPGPGDPSST